MVNLSVSHKHTGCESELIDISISRVVLFSVTLDIPHLHAYLHFFPQMDVDGRHFRVIFRINVSAQKYNRLQKVRAGKHFWALMRIFT